MTSDADAQRARDSEQLRRFGYAQQLLRDVGGFSSFALSFSIISILTGAGTLYGHGLRNGGPPVMSLGWPLVTVMSLFVAASLAQLASSHPTAGALYHWSALLGGPGWGFLTAWLNTLGQFAITAGIDYGLAEFLLPMLGLPPDSPGYRTHLLALYAALLASQALLNHVGVKIVARLNDLSAWYHLAGVALLVGALFFLAPRRELSFLLQPFTSERSAARSGANQETAGALVGRRPDQVAHALEPEHRVVDVERQHRHAVHAVRRGGHHPR